MTRRPQIVRRQPSPPQVAMWITDQMLKRAVERYQRRYIASCRGLSSHRGPLETRRRLGKRNMGGIMASPPSYRPLWHFEVIGTPNEWKWEPPTSPSTRRDKENRFSLSNLSDKLVKWLEDSDLDKPYLQPPDEATLLVDVPAAEGEVVSPVAPASFAQEIANLRTTICQTQNVDKQTMNQLRSDFCQTLGRRIREGDITVEDLMLAMEPLDSIASQHISHEHLALGFTASIQRFVVTTLARMRKKDSEDLYLEAWLAVADRVFAMETKNRDFRALRHLVEEASVIDRAQLPLGGLLEKTRLFLTTQSNRLTRDAGWVLRMARFAELIQSLDVVQQNSVDSGISDFIEQRDIKGEEARRLRYCWFLLQAHSKHLESTAFETALQDFLSTHGPLTRSEAWQVSTARLRATQVLSVDKHRNLIKGTYQTVGEQWTVCAAAVADPKRKNDVVEFCHTLRLMGHCGTLASGLLSSRLTDSKGEALRVVERIITDPRIHHRIMWDALDAELKKTRHSRRASDMTNGGVGMQARSLMDMVDKMAQWYLVAPHLSDRQALRGIELCLKAHRLAAGRSSSTALSSLAQAVIRDLEKGQWGRTERLRYLISVIAKDQGSNEAKKVAKILKGWRETIHEQNSDEQQRK